LQPKTLLLDAKELVSKVFKVRWRVVANGAVQPLAIIKGFNIRKDFSFGLGAALETATVDAFNFERAKEGFHGSVIVAATNPAHAGGQAVSGQQFSVGDASIGRQVNSFKL
jgi:hypothetical protein